MEGKAQKIRNQITSTAAKYIRNSVEQYLPHSAQKDFMLWILADDNPHQNEYLKMLGVASSIELEIAMLTNTFDDSTLQELLPYLGVLNAYFAFETIQDNLAIGLAPWFEAGDQTLYKMQHTIVKNFNPIMIAKLQGNPSPTEKLLAPYNEMVSNISAYKRCLSPVKMYEFANKFCKHHKDSTLMFELDHCFYPMLILNIETSLDLLRSLEDHTIHSLLKESLIARYTAVDSVLKSNYPVNLNDLADWGAKAILVLPTLVYCIGALDAITPNDALNESIQDGSLSQGIYSSALLVRLLNDMGTRLLTLNETERDQMFKKLMTFSHKQKFNSIFNLLTMASKNPEFSTVMIRIGKDMQYGEFNICLDNLKNIYNIPEALEEFFERVKFYNKLYEDYSARLIDTCNQLEKNFQNTTVSRFIFNMFKFHEQMYSIKFENNSGDYAVVGE